MPHPETQPAEPLLPYAHVAEATCQLRDAERFVEQLAPVLKELAERPSPQANAIFSLATYTEDLAAYQELGKRWRGMCDTLIVIGSGGSGLSGRALALLAGTPLSDRNAHRVVAFDSLNPFSSGDILQSFDSKKHCFLFVSKSGATVETNAMAASVLARLKSLGHTDIAERCVAITMPGTNPLRSLCESYGLRIFDHDPALGGRFSIFSSVGLIPAAYMNLDIAAFRKGMAAALHHNVYAAAAQNSPAVLGAAMQAAMVEKGRNVSVMMPYSERLSGLSLWWRQSWAESLGKEGHGSTPVIALGPADQHSQLQLWLDGPDDKLFSFLLTACKGQGPVIPPIEGALSYLSGHRIGDVVEAQQSATLQTVLRHNRPVRTFHLGTPDEYTFGALTTHLMLEIIFTGALFNINPFDQPAVEESKRLTHEYLTRGRS